MAAFTSSFLNADPFLSSAAQAGNTQDAYGNILNAAGQQVGVVPGSVADLGSKGTMPASAASTSSAPASSGNTSPSGFWANVAAFASNPMAYGDAGALAGKTGSTLENVVFIIIGLILIAAAVFSFKPAQDLAVGISKKAAEVAA